MFLRPVKIIVIKGRQMRWLLIHIFCPLGSYWIRYWLAIIDEYSGESGEGEPPKRGGILAVPGHPHRIPGGEIRYSRTRGGVQRLP